MLRQREPRYRDDRHLAFVRAAGCVVCPKGVNRPIEAAHVRMACIAIGKRETGMAEKPGDQWTLGLCIYHHRIGIASQHARGEREFWEYAALNPFTICQRLWIESGGAARALEPKPKRPRKIKARDRSAPKRKIQSRPAFPQGRKLQSRGFKKPGAATETRHA
jgi:hypothetical protein